MNRFLQVVPRVALATVLCTAFACKTKESGEPAGKGVAPLPKGEAKAIELVQQIAKCTWSDDDAAFDDCKAIDDFESYINELYDQDGADDKAKAQVVTLVGLLADKDVKMRAAAAVLLVDYPEHYREDKNLGAHVLAALEGESSSSVRYVLGQAAGHIELGKTGLGPRVLAFLEQHGDKDSLSQLIPPLAQAAPQCDACGIYVVDIAKTSKEWTLRSAAIRGMVPEYKPDQACALFVDAVKEGEFGVSSTALSRLAEWKDTCAGRFEDAVVAIENQCKDGSISIGTLQSANFQFLRSKSLDDALKQRVIKAARQALKTSKQGGVHTTVFSLLAEHDADAAKYIKPFASQTDYTGEQAKKTLEGLKAKHK